MAVPSNPLSRLRLPEAVRRRLEVATAMAWESLVEAHSSHALHFIALLAHRLPFDEAVERYLAEVDVPESISGPIRNRVLLALEHSESRLDLPEDDGGETGLRRFRPGRVMRGLIERHRQKDETESWVRLAIARAEEGMVAAHMDNAITFVALLDGHMPPERAVEEYLGAIALTGARAQGVAQRTLARIAEARFPTPAEGEVPG
jgi:hypothetical protein